MEFWRELIHSSFPIWFSSEHLHAICAQVPHPSPNYIKETDQFKLVEFFLPLGDYGIGHLCNFLYVEMG